MSIEWEESTARFARPCEVCKGDVPAGYRYFVGFDGKGGSVLVCGERCKQGHIAWRGRVFNNYVARLEGAPEGGADAG